MWKSEMATVTPDRVAQWEAECLEPVEGLRHHALAVALGQVADQCPETALSTCSRQTNGCRQAGPAEQRPAQGRLPPDGLHSDRRGGSDLRLQVKIDRGHGPSALAMDENARPHLCTLTQCGQEVMPSTMSRVGVDRLAAGWRHRMLLLDSISTRARPAPPH